MNQDAQEAALGLLNLSPSTSTIPLKRKQTDDSIRCICGYSHDDGFSIGCDECDRWCHGVCFGYASKPETPDQWYCWVCQPRSVDNLRDRAIKLQKEFHRKHSIAAERKPRKGLEGSISSNNKRKRRVSVIEEEHVDIEEPWQESFVPTTQDHVPEVGVRERLKKYAQHWRGSSAFAPVHVRDVAHLPQTYIEPIPESAFSHPSLSTAIDPSVCPPTYAMHTMTPITSDTLITPYTSLITPSSAYLSDPLNAYMHTGLPKPFVHLFGHPLDIALDSRILGNEGRFVRSGCRPNAVLRPVICGKSSTLTFGVFALRDIRPSEEIVLGWEWDDGNVVHTLPALMEMPGMFSSPPRSPIELEYYRRHMSNILHSLSSTFTTCACGAHARDCALNAMAAFVDGEVSSASEPASPGIDLGPLIGRERGFRMSGSTTPSGGMNDTTPHSPTPLSPSPTSNTMHKTTREMDSVVTTTDQVVEPELIEEENMPPKMRRRWGLRTSTAGRENEQNPRARVVVQTKPDNGMDVDMPPPPLPPDKDKRVSPLSQLLNPHSPDYTDSPSTYFSKLSLLSPVPLVDHPSPSFVFPNNYSKEHPNFPTQSQSQSRSHSKSLSPSPEMQLRSSGSWPKPQSASPMSSEHRETPTSEESHLWPTPRVLFEEKAILSSPPRSPRITFPSSETRFTPPPDQPQVILESPLSPDPQEDDEDELDENPFVPSPTVQEGDHTMQDAHSPVSDMTSPTVSPEPEQSQIDVLPQVPPAADDTEVPPAPTALAPSFEIDTKPLSSQASLHEEPSEPKAPDSPIVATPKVKMSLKDFAMRKKKQREEEESMRKIAKATAAKANSATPEPPANAEASTTAALASPSVKEVHSSCASDQAGGQAVTGEVHVSRLYVNRDESVPPHSAPNDYETDRMDIVKETPPQAENSPLDSPMHSRLSSVGSSYLSECVEAKPAVTVKRLSPTPPPFMGQDIFPQTLHDERMHQSTPGLPSGSRPQSDNSSALPSKPRSAFSWSTSSFTSRTDGAYPSAMQTFLDGTQADDNTIGSSRSYIWSKAENDHLLMNTRSNGYSETSRSRSRSPQSPSHSPHSSQEEGEIVAQPAPPPSRPGYAMQPRRATPPTQPRSMFGKQPPSGPRALRNISGRGGIPRGPSADRDRDRRGWR